jgi:lipid II:glycine glycyltransferase (peptidoglycan interpeptide bridge formation enzyme)
MTTISLVPGTAEAIESAQATWDRSVVNNGGHLLQSWNWGEFKRRHGWEVERITVDLDGRSANCQVLFKQGGPFTIAYVPRGPVIPEGDGQVTKVLFEEIDRVCRSRRALHVIFEPNKVLPTGDRLDSMGFVEGPPPFQPGRTVKVPLLPDDALLKQMHQKTRYSVRLAQRRGVEVERCYPTDESVDLFFGLLQDTSERNDFGIHSRRYYADFLDVFGSGALMLLARVEGDVAAGLVAAKFGDEAIYMYGGSSTKHRAHGAAFLLQFEAMRWAREAGCTRYDLWGIPKNDPSPASDEGDRISGTKGDDWRGLYRFKTGFGGDIITYPPTFERRYRPLLSLLARRRYGNRV